MSEDQQSWAEVDCKDGKTRLFVAAEDWQVFWYKGKKYLYSIWSDPERTGFKTMRNSGTDWELAPDGFQPLWIKAETSNGISWSWSRHDSSK